MSRSYNPTLTHHVLTYSEIHYFWNSPKILCVCQSANISFIYRTIFGVYIRVNTLSVVLVDTLATAVDTFIDTGWVCPPREIIDLCRKLHLLT